jgi:hypothetical protein
MTGQIAATRAIGQIGKTTWRAVTSKKLPRATVNS